MGKNNYHGGGFEEPVYDKKSNLLKKIYRELKSHAGFVTQKMINDYYEGCDEQQVKEDLEDMENNFKNRRDSLIEELRKEI